MTLGQRIREARIARGMTQKQLVDGSITRNMLSKIENDSATPSMRTLKYLAERLELTPAYLMQDSSYSDGTSPDGLDEMRAAYKEGRFRDCIDLLEKSKTAGTTDEGYLLRARASLAAAREALSAEDWSNAKEFADAADYYNKEGIYYSAEIDAEMSLILAECALTLDISEFEENLREFDRSARDLAFDMRRNTAKAEYLLKTGEWELAMRLLDGDDGDAPAALRARRLYLRGMCLLEKENLNEAETVLLAGEALICADDAPGGGLAKRIFAALEKCYMLTQNFRAAHDYAAKQISREE